MSKLHRAPRGLEYAACASSADVLTMGTVNGARSVTMESQIGKLEAGRKGEHRPDRRRVREAVPRPRTHLVDAILYRHAASTWTPC